MKAFRTIFALLFTIICSATLAAPPPPVPALPDTTRATTYALVANNCACAVNFALYGDGTDVDNWLQVYVNGVAKLSTDPAFGWAITSPTGPLATIPRPITNAILTFTAPQTATVVIVGDRRPRRTTQFPENRGVAARDLNQGMTDIIAVERELWDRSNRAIVAPVGEVLLPLPAAAARAGSLLAFDGTGQPTLTSPGIGTGNVVGPVVSVNNDVACWNGTTGRILFDCGVIGQIELTGDVTGGPSSVTVATTLKTVNANVGTFGDSTHHVQLTVNAKGLITAITAPLDNTNFVDLTGQATLAQLPTINNSTILANNSGAPAVPSALGPSSILDMIGSAQGDVLYRGAGGWVVLGPGVSGQLLTTNGAGADPAWTTASGTGTVTSVATDASIKTSIAANGAITATGTLSLWGGSADITNCTLAVTVPGNALTVNVKTQDGSTPSATNPCIIAFRSATLTTGDFTYVKVTAATAFATATSGSTFGASNSAPFRLWITAWNNAGTVELGVSKQSTSAAIFQINESTLQASTACNACGTATSSGVFYTTVGRTGLAIRILGYLDWETGLATAGTFATGPTKIQLMSPGVKKPGQVIQTVAPQFGNVTTVSTAGAATATNVTAAITPVSAINMVRYSACLSSANTTLQTTNNVQMYRGANAIGAIIRTNISNAGGQGGHCVHGYDSPAANTATTYVIKGATNGGSATFPAVNTDSATEILDEIQG